MYVLVGLFNTASSYSIYALFLFGGFSVWVSSFASIVLGIIMSYLTQGGLVFKNLTLSSAWRFLLNWVLIFFVYVVIVFSLENLGINNYMGGVIALTITTSLSYFSMNRYVFKKMSKK
jgi:putative flippase GtrA